MKRIGALFSRKKDRQDSRNSGGCSPTKRGGGKDNMDFLQLEEETLIQNILQEGELVIFSDNIEKFNRKNKKQTRSIMITNHFVYNLKGLKLKRKIEIQKIKKIITSRCSGEFILNVPDEYDYRYVSDEDKKQLILEILCSLSYGLQILFADQAELGDVVTTRVEKIQQQQFSSNLYGVQSENLQQGQLSALNQDSTQISLLRNSIQNGRMTLNLSQISNYSSSILLNKFDDSKSEAENSNSDILKQQKHMKIPSFDRCQQMSFNAFEMIEYQGYCDGWRYFRVRECGNESMKVYQMKVINTHTHLKKEDLSHKQFVKEQIQLMKELDSSYFCQQYYYIEQGHHFAILQEELETVKYIDLAKLIDEQSFLQENVVKIIAAQIAHSLNLLHQKKIVYNQVNPQDIKIDLAGNTILSRFEFSKFSYTPFVISPTQSFTQMIPITPTNPCRSLTFSSSIFNPDDSPKKKSKGQKMNSTHGKIDYFSPEMIKGNSNQYNSDWWSFGILLYEMLLGFTPFYHQNEVNMKEKILNQKDIFFPKMANISLQAKNLIQKCLDKDPKTRIKGSDILNHDFFTGIKWSEIKERVPQFEISELFNLEKQLSEGFYSNMSNTQKEEQREYTDGTISGERFQKYDSQTKVEDENNEDEEETIILSQKNYIVKREKIFCKDQNQMNFSNSTSELSNQS